MGVCPTSRYTGTWLLGQRSLVIFRSRSISCTYRLWLLMRLTIRYLYRIRPGVLSSMSVLVTHCVSILRWIRRRICMCRYGIRRNRRCTRLKRFTFRRWGCLMSYTLARSRWIRTRRCPTSSRSVPSSPSAANQWPKLVSSSSFPALALSIALNNR